MNTLNFLQDLQNLLKFLQHGLILFFTTHRDPQTAFASRFVPSVSNNHSILLGERFIHSVRTLAVRFVCSFL